MRTEKNLENLARNIIGKKRLADFREKRSQRRIPEDQVRQIFMVDVLEEVAPMKAPTLGEIAFLGREFDLGDYRRAFIVTDGTNGGSAIHLSTYDSGRTLVQKIVVATILKEIFRLINEDQPVFDEESDTYDNWILVPSVVIDSWEPRHLAVMKKLKWES